MNFPYENRIPEGDCGECHGLNCVPAVSVKLFITVIKRIDLSHWLWKLWCDIYYLSQAPFVFHLHPVYSWLKQEVDAGQHENTSRPRRMRGRLHSITYQGNVLSDNFSILLSTFRYSFFCNSVMLASKSSTLEDIHPDHGSLQLHILKP